MKSTARKIYAINFGIIILACLITTGISLLITYHFGGIEAVFKISPLLIFKDFITPCVIILLLGITLMLISKKVVSPFVKLSEVTKEVTAGNFDVVIPRIDFPKEGQELARDFEVMVKELQSVEKLRQNFISAMSHEFKTPLSIISGYAEVLEKPATPDSIRREYAVIIQKESARLMRLISGLLMLGKLNSQAIPDMRENFWLDEQIRQSILRLHPKWTAKNIDLDIDLDEIKFFGHKNFVEMVWDNLLDNAIRYTPQNGEISVTAHESKGMITMTVTDNGEGMTEAVQARIFEEFFRGHKDRQDKGTGLGLSIVKKIVTAAGGTISVKSAPGHGSIFTVVLPKQR